jgi:hypothetical protein
MFTIKYRTYSVSRIQNGAPNSPTMYDENEQIHGPFELVSKEQDENGFTVVHCHRAGDAPGMTFDPLRTDAAGQPQSTLWVMNEAGATVAKYDL